MGRPGASPQLPARPCPGQARRGCVSTPRSTHGASSFSFGRSLKLHGRALPVTLRLQLRPSSRISYKPGGSPLPPAKPAPSWQGVNSGACGDSVENIIPMLACHTASTAAMLAVALESVRTGGPASSRARLPLRGPRAAYFPAELKERLQVLESVIS